MYIVRTTCGFDVENQTLEKEEKLFWALSAYLPSVERFRGKVVRYLNPPLDDAWIDAEVRYARQEILRFWVDTLLLAWFLAEEPEEGLPLNQNLLPELTGVLEESRTSLYNAIALEDRRVEEMLQDFLRNIARALPVELPGGVTVEWNVPCRDRTDCLRLAKPALFQMS